MPATYSGTQIARSVLRSIGVLGPSEAGNAEQLTECLAIGTDLLDSWALDRRTIGGATRSVHSLTNAVQSYTIGDGATLDTDGYPSVIERWGVIPDDTETDPTEHGMGRPYNSDEWSRVTVKSQTGAYPTKMWFDHTFNSSGYGNCLFHPIPDNGNVDVALYCRIPVITSLAANTDYTLRPGYILALKLNLAVMYAMLHGREIEPLMVKKADDALGAVRRSNTRLKESPIRDEFVIGSRGPSFNIYTGGT